MSNQKIRSITYQKILDRINILTNTGKKYNMIFSAQVIHLLGAEFLLDEQVNNLELLVKNWKVENAFFLASNLGYECFNTKMAENWEEFTGKDLDFLKEDKYYGVHNLIFEKEFKKEAFFTYSNEDLLECIAKNFNYRLFQGMCQNTLDLLKEETPNE